MSKYICKYSNGVQITKGTVITARPYGTDRVSILEKVYDNTDGTCLFDIGDNIPINGQVWKWELVDTPDGLSATLNKARESYSTALRDLVRSMLATGMDTNEIWCELELTPYAIEQIVTQVESE